MNVCRLILLLIVQSALTACAVNLEADNHYKLAAFSQEQFSTPSATTTILVSQPEAVSGYQTESMRYVNKPFEVNSFVHSIWVGPPATMLFPLIMESLQYSHYFHAVASTPYSDLADYRLDTQLITLQQNFLVKPSVVELVVKVVLTHIADNQVIASRIFSHRVPCPSDNPYGGVIAANQAVKALTHDITRFVINEIKP